MTTLLIDYYRNTVTENSLQSSAESLVKVYCKKSAQGLHTAYFEFENAEKMQRAYDKVSWEIKYFADQYYKTKEEPLPFKLCKRHPEGVDKTRVVSVTAVGQKIVDEIDLVIRTMLKMPEWGPGKQVPFVILV